MGYVVAELASIALFAGFIGLTQYEIHLGARILPRFRASIDRFATRVSFVIMHVDFAEFIHESIRQIVERFVHDSAQMALRITRYVEMRLSRIVRYFRARFATRDMDADGITQNTTQKSSAYVRAITDFKQKLRNETKQSKDKHSIE
ncbi:hypothetical protein MNBD_CPR01-349 [hydrothermal vent metagenome]|uniref:Uncharacterized protein n=1 Tax=hydrothermal vent metagenome TaxID=652676 RepID=A0A3B0V0X9_9ZZZZ